MAKNKKSMIGFDPLAWLDEEAVSDEVASAETSTVLTQAEKKQNDPADSAPGKASAKKSGRKTPAKKSRATVKQIGLLGHKLDETALLKGYELAADKLDSIVEDFYTQLFSQYPEIQLLFAHSDPSAQKQKMQAAIKLLIDQLHQPEKLQQTLQNSGRRHQAYGVLPEHYPLLVELLTGSFKQQLGRRWTKAINAAWQTLLTAASAVMCDACDNVRANQAQTPAADTVQSEELTTIEPDESQTMRAESLLELQATQDISQSAALKAEMLSLLETQQTIQIDASRVERIDGSALQLLCALFVQAESSGLSLQWIEPSDALLQAARYSGLTTLLNLQS